MPRPCAVLATAKVRPTVLMKPAVPRPTMLLVSSVGSIMDEMLLVRAWTVLVKKEGCQGAAPLIVETWREGVEILVALMNVVEKDEAARRADVCVIPTIFRLFTGWMLRLEVASPVIVPTV